MENTFNMLDWVSDDTEDTPENNSSLMAKGRSAKQEELNTSTDPYAFMSSYAALMRDAFSSPEAFKKLYQRTTGSTALAPNTQSRVEELQTLIAPPATTAADERDVRDTDRKLITPEVSADVGSSAPSAGEAFSNGLMSSQRPQQRPEYELPDVDTSGVDVPVSKAPDPNKVASYSFVNKPIVEGEGRGNSRRAGDAPKEVIDKSIKTIIAAGQRAGMSKDEIALTLAIARHESGFNPDAAAPSTSAHGLGQFIDTTGANYGLTDGNRWDVEKQAEALVAHTKDNIALAKKRGKGTEYVYKYHHDGPSGEYGGLKTSKNKVMPYIDYFKNMLGG